MQATQAKHTVRQLIELRRYSMLAANPAHQRGAVSSRTQQRKLIDSLLRGYPLPIIYLRSPALRFRPELRDEVARQFGELVESHPNAANEVTIRARSAADATNIADFLFQFLRWPAACPVSSEP
jgi:hypothetical protein